MDPQTRTYIQGQLRQCREIFERVNDYTSTPSICSHSGFHSRDEFVSSTLEVLKLSAQSMVVLYRGKVSQASNDDERALQGHYGCLAHAKKYNDKMPADANGICQQCANLMMARIFQLYSGISGFAEARDLVCCPFHISAEFEWLGQSSLYIAIGRHYYRNTNIVSILYSRFVSFCEMLMATEMVKKLNQLSSSFQLFSMSLAANLYRLSKDKWLQLDIDHDLLHQTLDIIYRLIRVCWRMRFKESKVTNAFGTTLDVLFIILVFGLIKLKYDVSRGRHPINIRRRLKKLKSLLSTNMRKHSYYKWFLQSTLILFDRRESVNCNRFYRQIKKYSNRSRVVMHENSRCNNEKCSKSGLHCKYSCSRCRSAIYCSRRCQKFDWNRGGHKRLCGYFCIES